MSIIDTRFEFEVLFLLSLLLDYGRIINILCMRFYVFCFLCTTNSPHIFRLILNCTKHSLGFRFAVQARYFGVLFLSKVCLIIWGFHQSCFDILGLGWEK